MTPNKRTIPSHHRNVKNETVCLKYNSFRAIKPEVVGFNKNLKNNTNMCKALYSQNLLQF